MNAYEQDAKDEMDLVKNTILGVLALTLVVMAVLIGYEYWINPKNPSHTIVLIMYGALCSSASFIYLHFVKKAKVASITSVVIALLFWAMVYTAMFTQ